jgi:hypothetical protein
MLAFFFCLTFVCFLTLGDSSSFSSSIESRKMTSFEGIASSSSDSSLPLGDNGGSAAKETRAQKITNSPNEDANATCGRV